MPRMMVTFDCQYEWIRRTLWALMNKPLAVSVRNLPVRLPKGKRPALNVGFTSPQARISEEESGEPISMPLSLLPNPPRYDQAASYCHRKKALPQPHHNGGIPDTEAKITLFFPWVISSGCYVTITRSQLTRLWHQAPLPMLICYHVYMFTSMSILHLAYSLTALLNYCWILAI